jgi:hypothetical protein
MGRGSGPRWRPRHRSRTARFLTTWAACCLVAAACTTADGSGDAGSESAAPSSEAETAAPPPLRAFTADSWWNTPVPRDAPIHPEERDLLQYLSTERESGDGCLRLAGTEDNKWGQPVYWATDGDTEYDVRVDAPIVPPEMASLRIPEGAEAADNNDGSMSIFDVERGYTVALTEAEYDSAADSWSAGGATVTYLDSNGLHARTGQASDDRNLGTHRGNNAAVMMARIDEVEAGRIEHVLKIASGPEASRRFVFPMVASDGDSRAADAPPQGLRLRIKPSVELDELELDRQTMVIARAMQEYGVYIGDSGSVTTLKLEDTRISRGEQLWNMAPTALCGLPLTPEFWDVLAEGYRPSPG